MRQFTAIVNPAAGSGHGAAALVPLGGLLREAGADLEVISCTSLDHGRALARDAAERRRVVLGVGGDGTVGGVLGAVADTEAVCGIVPSGRGNDFARALGVPTEPGELARLLLHGPPRPVDTIETRSAAHGRVTVLGSVYAGVDALANRHANTARFLPGAWAYYAGGLRAVLTWRTAAYRVTVDGTVHDRAGYTVVAANSGFYGQGRNIAPGAVLDDGLLDVVILHAAPRRLFFAVMSELRDGRHIRRPQCEVMRGREVRIEADRPISWGADGEVDHTLPVTARVRPASLRLLAPA